MHIENCRGDSGALILKGFENFVNHLFFSGLADSEWYPEEAQDPQKEQG